MKLDKYLNEDNNLKFYKIKSFPVNLRKRIYNVEDLIKNNLQPILGTHTAKTIFKLLDEVLEDVYEEGYSNGHDAGYESGQDSADHYRLDYLGDK